MGASSLLALLGLARMRPILEAGAKIGMFASIVVYGIFLVISVNTGSASTVLTLILLAITSIIVIIRLVDLVPDIAKLKPAGGKARK